MATLVAGTSANAATIYTWQSAFDAAGGCSLETEDFHAATEVQPAPFTDGAFSFAGDARRLSGTGSWRNGNVNDTT